MCKVINLAEKREEKKMERLAKQVVEEIMKETSQVEELLERMLRCGNCHGELFAVLETGILCSVCGVHIGYDEFF